MMYRLRIKLKVDKSCCIAKEQVFRVCFKPFYYNKEYKFYYIQIRDNYLKQFFKDSVELDNKRINKVNMF